MACTFITIAETNATVLIKARAAQLNFQACLARFVGLVFFFGLAFDVTVY